MRAFAALLFLALSALPGIAFAQADQAAPPQQQEPPPEVAQPPAETVPAPAPHSTERGLTREQYVERVRQRAGQRAGQVFDEMDTNHDGVVDRDEMRA